MDNQGKVFDIVIENQPISLRFKRPTVEELMAIDMEYRRIYSEAVRAGVMTEPEARKAFKKNGIWTKDNEKFIDDMSLTVATLSAMLQKLTSEKDKREDAIKLVNKITEARNEMISAIKERTELFSNTAEGIANDQKMHKFCELCCCRADTNEGFFDSHEHYARFAQANKEALSEIYKQAYHYEYGMSEDLTADWEEVKYLTQLADQLKEEASTVLPIDKPAPDSAPVA